MYCIDHGVDVFYDGPNVNQIYKNWKSCHSLSADVRKDILAEVSKGRKIGPFSSPPLPNYMGSPMGAFEKLSAAGRKVRVITDLSWPPGGSVNSFISKELSSISYITIDDATKMVKNCGKGCLMAKLDIAEAYRHILIQPQDWHLLGTTWICDDDSVEFYIDTRLPFGLRTSARLFTMFADGLQFIMLNNGTTRCLHYIDDYFSCAPSGSDECYNNLKCMISSCEAAGFPVNPKKVVPPTSKIEFLGIEIDSIEMSLSMSDDRIDKIITELEFWRYKRKGSKRQLLSLLGKLVFVGRVVRPGRVFTRRLIEVTKKLCHLHHRTRLSHAAQGDIKWWLAYIKSWNKLSLFYEDEWSYPYDLQFATDACDLGYGMVLQSSWAYGFWDTKQQAMDIAWKELYCLVLACNTWSHRFKSKKIIVYCDNMAVVTSVNKGASKSADLMYLIRMLFFIAAAGNFECRLVYIPSNENIAADLLSRNKLASFHQNCPLAELQPTKVSIPSINNAFI